MATIEETIARRQREAGPGPLVPAELTPEQQEQLTEFESVRARSLQLIDLREGFNTPADWAAINQEYMESLRQAQFEGAANISELGPDYIPIEWKQNYRNEANGPRGEALPADALGWLPNTGKPDFGGGFSGVLKSAWYSLYDKPRGKIEARDIGAFGPTATSLREDLNERLSRDVKEEDVGKEFLGLTGTLLSHGVQYLKDLWATAEDNETIFGKTTQFIGAGFDLVAGSAEELAKVVETEVIGPQLLASDELIRRGAENGIIPEGEAEWLDKFRPLGGFSALAPVAVAAKYRLQGVISEKDYAAAVDRNQDAARMAYTAWFDPAAKEEYVRRMRAGDDPRLLALELENPGAEMVGRIIFDPLNLIDVLQVGSIITKTNQLNRARNELTTIADPAFAKALDNLSAVGEAGTSPASREVLSALGNMYDATREGRIEVAGRRGFFRATAGGKRATYGQRSSNFMATILSVSGNDPDLANSVWHGLVLVADADDAKRLRGLTILSQAIADSKGALTPGILFSSSANETAILLRRLLENDVGEFDTGVLLRMLEDAGDDPEKLASLLDNKLNDALAKDFPTIQEQVALNEEYAKLDSEEAAQFLERNPLANRDPGAFYKSLAKVDDALQPIYRRMGEFQARLFMGTPPASWRYRANNRWGNFMPTLVDIGPEPAIKGLLKGFPGFPSKWSPQASMDEIARNLGGVLPEGAIRGLGPARSFRGGELTEAKEDWLSRTTTSGLRGAADDEAANAAHVVNTSVRKTMKSYMKAERRIINKELASLSDEQRNLVMAAMREKYYNVDDAIDVLRSDDGYDISRNLAFLNDDEIEELRELRIYDAALLAARENDDLEDVLRTIDDILEERSRTGMVAGGEAPALSMEDVAGESVVRESHVPKQYENVRATDLHMRRRKEINEFDRLYEDALFGPAGLQRMATEQIMRNSLVEGARIGMTDDQKVKMAMAQLDGVTGPLQQEIRVATDGTFDTSRAFTNETWELSDLSKGRKTGDTWLTRKWMERDAVAKQFGLPGLGDPPRGLTARQFRDAIWQHETSSYYKIQDARWTQLREQNLERYREVAARLAGAAGIEDFRTPAVNAAEAQLIRSRMMDEAELAADGTAVVRGGRVTASSNTQDLQRIFDEIIPGRVRIKSSPERIAIEGRRQPATIAIELNVGDKPWEITVSDDFFELGPISKRDALVEELAHTLIDLDRDGFKRVFGNTSPASTEVQAQAVLNPKMAAPEHLAWVDEVLENNPDVDAALKGLRELDLGGTLDDIPVVGSMDDAAPTPYRIFHETQPAAVDAAERLKQGLQDNWGQTGRMGALDPEVEQALEGWATGARGRVTEARAQAISVANQTRDFILHNYPVRYGADLVAGYIWPYQFWHSRTYLKWMQRMIMHPGMVAAYSHYRNALEKQHAGMQPWWRRNINVTDLLGIETDSPLWFNLERSLNPIQGLTGVDFTDPKMRLDNWSATLEDLNKFGPSVWMPYQVLLALKYHIDGEEEAASRWAGRLWSPTGAFRDLTALVDPEGLGVELDPFIHLFSGGIGPRERGRVGRQFGAAQDEGIYSQAELIDAARIQSGPIWDEMRARAINQRAPNVPFILAPFFLGGGFKMRTESDAQIDMFYSEMIGLMRKKEDLEPDEYRQAWNDLERRYPFMDVLLLSKKSGPDRDEALAWSVLDRIPPAMTDDIAELVGINPDIIGLFHENNGSLEEMTEADRLQFMGAILEMAAILDVPDNATKAEWETAKSLRREMLTQGEELFGEDIWERVDAWWAVFDPEDRAAGDAMMARDPDIGNAQDWQQRMIMSTPLLGAYYTSEERIRKFYKRQLYDAAEEIFGEDLWDHLAVQAALFDAGDRKAAFQYRDDHPQLKGWTEMRDQALPGIEEKVNRLGELLPEAIEPVFRDREAAALPDAPPLPSREDWVNAQVLAYSTGQQQDDAPKDVRKFIREQADNQWPGTRSLADRYYRTEDPERAREILLDSSALAARVAWESEALRQLELVQRGRFAETGAQPQPDPIDWQQLLGPSAYNLTLDALEGEELPLVARNKLDEIALQLGLGDWQDVVGRIGEATGMGFEETAPAPTNGREADTQLQSALGNLGGPRRSPGISRPRPPSAFMEIIDSVVFGLKSIGHTILSFFGPTEAQEQLAQHLNNEFPGFKQSVIEQSKKIVEDPKALEKVNPGGGIAPWNLDIGPIEIITPALVSDVTERYIILHELGHEMDELGPGKDNFSGSDAFRRAVLKTIAMDIEETKDQPWASTRESLVLFPGIGRNVRGLGRGGPAEIALTGGWGGYQELYAEAFSLAEGYLDNVPPPMRPFYREFMNFAPDQGSLYKPPEKSLAAGLSVQTYIRDRQEQRKAIKEQQEFRERQSETRRIEMRNRADDLFGPSLVNRAFEEIQKIDEVSDRTLGMVVDVGRERGLQEDEAVAIFIYLISAGERIHEDESLLGKLEPFG